MPAKRKNAKLSQEDLDAPVALKERVFTMLRDDLYWHDRIKRILAAAGFVTRRIEHEEAHPVWRMYLTRTSFDLSPDQPTAAKQIRKVLVKGGIKIQRDDLSIVSRSKNWIQCAFFLELGAPGVLELRPQIRH